MGPGIDAEPVILESIVLNQYQSRTVPLWKATGLQPTPALTTVVDHLDEEHAPHLVGAALHALILAKQDPFPDAVLRLAERAACWDTGRRSTPLSHTGATMTHA